MILNDVRRALRWGLLFSVISLLFPTALSAQASRASPQTKPTKLMEFTGFDWEDVISRLDYLDEYVRKNEDVKVYVFVYGGKVENAPESLNARMRCLDEYLGNRRHTPRPNFEVIKAGYRKRATIEFWISYRNGPEPPPAPSISKASVKYKYRRDKTVRLLCNN